jgi:hypothetical protein
VAGEADTARAEPAPADRASSFSRRLREAFIIIGVNGFQDKCRINNQITEGKKI